MAAPKPTLEITCPHCGARLSVDAELGKVLHHQPPPKPAHAPDLDRAAKLLQQEKERREALFKQSVDDQKVSSEVLERKFAESLKKAKDEPVTRPLRDLDLD
jgi:predicted amidophosphoribosyltransferase